MIPTSSDLHQGKEMRQAHKTLYNLTVGLTLAMMPMGRIILDEVEILSHNLRGGKKKAGELWRVMNTFFSQGCP